MGIDLTAKQKLPPTLVGHQRALATVGYERV
jgi:hypothetical protein